MPNVNYMEEFYKAGCNQLEAESTGQEHVDIMRELMFMRGCSAKVTTDILYNMKSVL
jgi:hypothetical protein